MPVAREYKTSFDVNSTKMDQEGEMSKVTKRKKRGSKTC
jgi:hypothetical protein